MRVETKEGIRTTTASTDHRKLELAAQNYFKEGLEDDVTVYYFDGYQATIKHFNMTKLS